MGASVQFWKDKNATPCCRSLFIPDASDKSIVRCRACFKAYTVDFPTRNAKENVTMGQYQGLRGEGLIVLDATTYSNIVEYGDEKDAQAVAARTANLSGCAIIYAPVAIVRPKIADVSMETPKALGRMLRKALPLLGKQVP